MSQLGSFSHVGLWFICSYHLAYLSTYNTSQHQRYHTCQTPWACRSWCYHMSRGKHSLEHEWLSLQPSWSIDSMMSHSLTVANRPNLLLMEELLHQLISTLSHHLQGFIHPRWCRISSINSMVRSTKNENWWNMVIRKKKQQLAIRSGYEPYEKGIIGITLHPFFWKGFIYIYLNIYIYKYHYIMNT